MAEGSKMHRVISVMHLMSATSHETSIKMEDLVRLVQPMSWEEVSEVVRRCVELDYLREAGGRYFLTYKGQLFAISINS
ncbi:MAG: hypothetical protein QXT74_03045 [Candidatus Nezhaarchaeales archaeon]